MNRVLVLVDEVDELSGLVWSEVPAANRAVRVVLVLRLAVPRCQSEHVDELGVGSESLRWQRGELLDHSLVGDDVVHDLAAQPLPNERLHVRERPSGRILASTQDLLGLCEQPAIRARIAYLRIG